MIDPWDVLRVTASVARGGLVIVQLESLVEGGDLGYVPMRSPFGFRGQLRDPDGSANAGEALVGWEGDRGHALVLDDARYNRLLPDEGKGGSVQYGVYAEDALSYVLCNGATGAITVRTGKDAGPVRIEREAAGAPLLELNDQLLELGATGGDFVLIDKGGALSAWMQAVGAALGIAAPPVVTATLVKAK